MLKKRITMKHHRPALNTGNLSLSIDDRYEDRDKICQRIQLVSNVHVIHCRINSDVVCEIVFTDSELVVLPMKTSLRLNHCFRHFSSKGCFTEIT